MGMLAKELELSMLRNGRVKFEKLKNFQKFLAYKDCNISANF